MFNQLSGKFQDIFKTLRGTSKITEENVDSAIREVRRALIDADVSLRAIKTFTNKVREKAIGQDVLKGISASEQFVKIIRDELTALLTAPDRKDAPAGRLNTILMLGLQGAGKTTTCAKLAKLLKKKGKNPLLVPLDLKRPAAIEQLKILGGQVEVAVYGDVRACRGMPQRAQNAIDFAKENNYDVVILDTAGRLQIDTEMMAELLLVDRAVKPEEKFLVIDSMIGQEAANIAAAFNTQIGITGIILTKLDGDSRGGAALSVVEETQKPIKFIGIGEKLDDLQEFYPDRLASRILGMGDVLTLVEQAQEQFDVDSLHATNLQDFNFESFLQILGMMNKLGSFSSLFNMTGMQGMMNQFAGGVNKETQEKMLSEGEVKMKKFKSAIQSMTKKERLNPNLINMSRRTRIAKGCGLKLNDVDKLINEFTKMKKMMDTMKPLMGALPGANPNDLLKGMLPPGMTASAKPKGNLSKGFKPKRAK